MGKKSDSINRFKELDALRGLAAFTVVIYHCFKMVPGFESGNWRPLFTMTPFFIFGAGPEAVVLFFILSGFVLSQPYLKGNVNYSAFYVKRFCRIYLPYLVSVLLLFVVVAVIGHRDVLGISEETNLIWRQSLNFKAILEHILFIGYFNYYDYNPVIWTLVHEARLSIVFPLLAFCAIRFSWQHVLLGSLLLSYGARILAMYLEAGFLKDFLMTVFFSAMFIWGIVIAKYRIPLSDFIKKFSKTNVVFFLLAGIVFYTFRYWTINFPPSFIISNSGTLMASIGGTIFILAALTVPLITQVLHNRAILFLGHISFSLYLYHMVINVVLVQLLAPNLPIYLLSILTISISILFATFAYYYIEKPTIALGKMLSGKIQRIH